MLLLLMMWALFYQVFLIYSLPKIPCSQFWFCFMLFCMTFSTLPSNMHASYFWLSCKFLNLNHMRPALQSPFPLTTTSNKKLVHWKIISYNFTLKQKKKIIKKNSKPTLFKNQITGTLCRAIHVCLLLVTIMCDPLRWNRKRSNK